MNAFYVTVSIPILLVLAGFNNAHGLTTFGKSNGQGQGHGNQQSAVHGKPCTSQANCTFIKGTTCLRGFCLCGDDSHPSNGICATTRKGPGHICTIEDKCVDGATCEEPDEPPKGNNGALGYKTCQCEENLTPRLGRCSGGTNLAVIPGFLLVSLVLSRIY